MVLGHIYFITGTQFNGISQACSYGGNAQMTTNYPIANLTNAATETEFFLRTFNHSILAIATGNTSVSTNLQVPSEMSIGQWN